MYEICLGNTLESISYANIRGKRKKKTYEEEQDSCKCGIVENEEYTLKLTYNILQDDSGLLSRFDFSALWSAQVSHVAYCLKVSEGEECLLKWNWFVGG